ncbi:hypothetical protein P154DRAFT_581843 [Amniculicola lignicola CBS 123094]|uniref:Uncharacterized protein n=1 Tax=Amniculicola lignicola CBS 123094 TaxID=1392246 RepID=A0A6A5VZC1_9PLEO|nr:hypothetical protein P154DRAFT_581843 [Amniculicola lignicola CBS 123094]
MSGNDLFISAAQRVYIGTWTNWSHGRVFGSTLTLHERDGNILIAFIALFASYAGTSFFRVTCFALHVRLSRPTPEDGIHHQRQAILRNSASAADALWHLTQLLWSRRRAKRRVLLRIIPLLVYSVLCLSVFTAAGIFSSQINSFTGDEVLIRSPNCGTLYVNGDYLKQHPDSRMKIYDPYKSQRLRAFNTYAQTCYGDSGSFTRGDCKLFAKRRLSYTVNRNAGCPFASEMCKSQNENIILDTGYMDSHYDFGMNGPIEKRAQVKAVVHCAPLVADGYSKSFNLSNNQWAAAFDTFWYGQTRTSNYTFVQPQAFPLAASIAESARYSLRIFGSRVYNGSIRLERSDFNPITPLQRFDADMWLISLADNGIRYTAAIDDPWFSAHTRGSNITIRGYEGEYPSFVADKSASVLGCTEQYQVCAPSRPVGDRCSRLGGLLDPTGKVNATDPTFDLKHRVFSGLSYARFNDIAKGLGDESLRARSTLNTIIQVPLPNNQWQLEMERWFQIMLSGMQASSVETAVGPTTNEMKPFYIGRNDTEDFPGDKNTEFGYFCDNQKIRSTEHANFSVFGLSLTLAVGCLIILLNWSVEWIYIKLVWHFPYFNQYARLEWTINGTLQLQRLAHEELGYGNWTNCDMEVPVPGPDEKLAWLDMHDPEHPKLAVCQRVKTFGMSIGSFAIGRLAKQETSTTFGSMVSPISPSTPNDQDEIEIGFRARRWDTNTTLT